MKTLVVDDSRREAASLARIIDGLFSQDACEVALDAQEALAKCKDTHYDVVFLDVEMPDASGFDVARELKGNSPSTNVVFVTGHSRYALDAWGTQASAFLLKPVDVEDVRRALGSLRSPIDPHYGQGLFVRCFGNFEVFYDSEPVCFERSKTKELLAYLLDRRGALVSMGELAAVLWEGLPDTPSRRSQLRTLISDLRRTFERLGLPDVIIKRRGCIAVRLTAAECDYYGFIHNMPSAVNSYNGEYMCQYSWAESTAALLEASKGGNRRR
jgi:two-component SAPR family response regulator